MSGRALPPARLLAVVAPVSVVGVSAYIAATVTFFRDPGSWTTLAGVSAFLVASTLAERFPVPVEDADANGVSLGFVFAVAALVLFGWAPATFIYVTAPTLVALMRGNPAIRTIFNAGVFGIVGSIAGLVLSQMNGTGAGAILAQVTVTSAILYAVNLLLVTAAISASGSELSYIQLVRSNVRWTALPFTLMASTALMLVVLWQRTPFLFAALAGPLVAISLYQRSTHRALSAMRLALTDPLTGLGNHRHFHERLQREMALADEADTLVSLCFLDVDDFKRINDRFGHPAGDRVLSLVSARLRQGGEAFRLGGDEFAVLLPGADEQVALAVAESIIARIGEADLGPVGAITVSAGVATYPQHGRERDSLIRLADGALYWAKEHGKNQVRLARSDVAELSEFRKVASGVDRAARFRAAASLARAVDSRDAYTGSHSERVALLAGEIAESLGLSTRGDRADPARGEPARPGQARDPGGDPAQAGGPDRPRAPRAGTSSADRPPHAREPRCRADRRMGAASPRALGRGGLSDRSRRRGDPDRRARDLRRRRIRCDDLEPALPAGALARGGARGGRTLLRHPVRP